MTLNKEFAPSASTQTNGAALLYTASDLQPLWASMICTVLSLHAGNTHEQRQSTLLSTYFPYLVEKSVALWWFYSISWVLPEHSSQPSHEQELQKEILYFVLEIWTSLHECDLFCTGKVMRGQFSFNLTTFVDLTSNSSTTAPFSFFVIFAFTWPDSISAFLATISAQVCVHVCTESCNTMCWNTFFYLPRWSLRENKRKQNHPTL